MSQARLRAATSGGEGIRRGRERPIPPRPPTIAPARPPQHDRQSCLLTRRRSRVDIPVTSPSLVRCSSAGCARAVAGLLSNARSRPTVIAPRTRARAPVRLRSPVTPPNPARAILTSPRSGRIAGLPATLPTLHSTALQQDGVPRLPSWRTRHWLPGTPAIVTTSPRRARFHAPTAFSRSRLLAGLLDRTRRHSRPVAALRTRCGTSTSAETGQARSR